MLFQTCICFFFCKTQRKTGVQATLDHTEFHYTNKKQRHFSEYPPKKEGRTDLEQHEGE